MKVIGYVASEKQCSNQGELTLILRLWTDVSYIVWVCWILELALLWYIIGQSVPDTIYHLRLVLFKDIPSGLWRIFHDKRHWQRRHPRKQTGPCRLYKFFELCTFSLFFPDRLSFNPFHAVVTVVVVRDDECSVYDAGRCFRWELRMCQFVSPPDPAYQEAGEERIVSWNSGPILGVSMVLIICPLFFKSSHIFLFSFLLPERDVLLWQAIASIGFYIKNCTSRIQVAVPKKRRSTLDNRVSEFRGHFSMWSSGHGRQDFGNQTPENLTHSTAAVVIWFIRPLCF